MPHRHALIIGSGFESLPTLGEPHRVSTRFGDPSAPVQLVDIGGCPVLSLARHGRPHSIPPHAINYRANLLALSELGATTVIALNTVGVITDVCAPGSIALPAQIIDYTWGREHTIFDGADGRVEHIEFTLPFSEGLRRRILDAAGVAGVPCHDGGVYAATQGPRLETAAEIDRFERDGADFVGMTAMPEAAIAAELGLDYASIAMVVNQAAGRSDVPIHADVEANTAAARAATWAVLQHFFETELQVSHDDSRS